MAETAELTPTSLGDDEFVLSKARQLALWAILGVAVLLPISPPVLAAWSVLDRSALERAMAGFELVSRIAILVQLGNLPLFLILANVLARSPKDQ